MSWYLWCFCAVFIHVTVPVVFLCSVHTCHGTCGVSVQCSYMSRYLWCFCALFIHVTVPVVFLCIVHTCHGTCATKDLKNSCNNFWHNSRQNDFLYNVNK